MQMADNPMNTPQHHLTLFHLIQEHCVSKFDRKKGGYYRTVVQDTDYRLDNLRLVD